VHKGCRSIIIGLGSPIRSDDAVGPEVARRVFESLDSERVECREMAVGGIELVESLVGYDHAVIVDAIQREGGRIGECYRLDLEHVTQPEPPGFSHQFGLVEGLELARRLGMDVPSHLSVYVVEVADPYTISETMTPEVMDAVPAAVEKILREEFRVSSSGD
jgi:hydrogenase maturation protease